jgi:hypothetical protein
MEIDGRRSRNPHKPPEVRALALYAWSPAVRAAVNPAITAAIAALGPAAVSAGAPSCGPSRRFWHLGARRAPILAIVAAWEALNAIIGKGSDLLSKYGNASRSLDSPGMAATFERLTKLQPKDDGTTAAQAREAAELNTRLDQAKFKLGETLSAQINLNDAALVLQRIWVNIVEKLAEYAEKASNLGPPDTGLEQAIKDTGYQATGKGDIDERFAAIRDARRRISAELGSRAGDGDSTGTTFTARWNAIFKAFEEKVPKAKDDVAALRGEFDRLLESMQRHIASQEADVLSMGKGAAEQARLRAEFRLTEAAQQDIAKNGGQLSDYADRIKMMADRAAEAAAALEKARVASQIDFQKKTLFLSSDSIQIAQQLRGIYGNDVPAALASTEAAQMRLNGAIREGYDNALKFAETLVQGLFDAKAGSDSVAKGLEALSKSLASTAIKQLLSGDFEKAAVSAISAVVTWVASLVSHTSDLKSTIDTLDRLNQLRLRFVQATNDTNTLQGQLAVFDANAVLQQIDEARKGGALMTALIQVQQAERLKIESDFQKQAAELEKQAADARLARQQSLEDRIFAATNDTSTLQGALAAQQRDFAKERLDEAKNNNLDLAQLTVAQQAEELALRKSFNDKAIEETKRAEQERLDAINGTAKTTVEFLTGLQSGPNATVSPTTNLANSLALYNANLPLAQVGNIDAQNKFVSLADNLEKAARAVYASGQGYQDIRSQIISQGLALPAVQTTTDPVVIELRNVLAAVNTVNATTASNPQNIANLILPTMGEAMTQDEFALKLTGMTLNTLDSVSRARLLDVFNELDGNGNGILERSEAVRAATQGVQATTQATANNLNISTPGSIAAEEQWHSQQNGLMQGLQSTANQQLSLLNAQLNAASQNVVTGQTFTGVNGTVINSGQTVNNNMLQALNKIVFNTKLIVDNTSYVASWGTGSTHSGHADNTGIFAQGGIASPGMPIIYGEHHPQGPFFGRVGAQPIAITPAMPSFGGANDNSEMRALRQQVKELTEQVAAFRKENGVNTMNAARHVGEKVEENTEAVSDGMGKVAFETRQAARKVA